MGHHINAIIGSRISLAPLISKLGGPPPTELDFGLVIVPLDEERLDALAMSDEGPHEGFTYLKPRLVEAVSRLLGSGRALYIETDYFGGIGGQAAALFEDGAMTWQRHLTTEQTTEKPSWFGRLFGARRDLPSKSPISHGLQVLGVDALPGSDEFDRLGLGRFRSLGALGIEYED